jgi:uncharacterized protein
LIHLKTSQVLIARLSKADRFVPRLIGLLGRTELPADQGIWFPRCRSVHSFFMRMNFDCIVLDAQLNILEIFSDFKPWRVSKNVKGASSIIEIQAGLAKKLNLRKGEPLHVGPAHT